MACLEFVVLCLRKVTPASLLAAAGQGPRPRKLEYCFRVFMASEPWKGRQVGPPPPALAPWSVEDKGVKWSGDTSLLFSMGQAAEEACFMLQISPCMDAHGPHILPLNDGPASLLGPILGQEWGLGV